MKITEVRVYVLNGNSKVKALASVTFDDEFVVRSFRVVDGRNGLFVTMPQYEYNDEWKDIAFPLSKDFRDDLSDAVIAAYEDECAEKEEKEDKKNTRTTKRGSKRGK